MSSHKNSQNSEQNLSKGAIFLKMEPKTHYNYIYFPGMIMIIIHFKFSKGFTNTADIVILLVMSQYTLKQFLAHLHLRERTSLCK